MSGSPFPYDVFLSHRAKDKQAVAVPKVVRPLAEPLIQPLAFSLQPFPTGSLAQFL